MSALPGQLDLLDLLDVAESDPVDPATFEERYRMGALYPGEACPACGFIFSNGGRDASNNHYPMPLEPGLCIAMSLTRSHVVSALRRGSHAHDLHVEHWPHVPDFARTIRRAYQVWGDRADAFVPTEYRPCTAMEGTP